jgi:hypothetical protein
MTPLVVNLFGGPCSGKSTSAASIFAYLKNRGIRAELVHEAAKRFIYKGAERQLKNQVYVMAKQYSAIFDLAASGCDVAISDSPLICNLLYADSVPYYEELRALTLCLDKQMDQINLFVDRTKNFDGFGRMQKTLEEAAVYDVKAKELMAALGREFDMTFTGDELGQREAGRFVMKALSTRVGYAGTGKHYE